MEIRRLTPNDLQPNRTDTYIYPGYIFDVPISIYAKSLYLYLCYCVNADEHFPSPITPLPDYETIKRYCSIAPSGRADSAIKELKRLGALKVPDTDKGSFFLTHPDDWRLPPARYNKLLPRFRYGRRARNHRECRG